MSWILEWISDNNCHLKLWDMQPVAGQIYGENIDKPNYRDKEKYNTLLVKSILHPDCQLIKDHFGKPFLEPKNTQINYSHTKNYLFWGQHPTQRIGVDIETIREQIGKIKHKFCSESELLWCNQSESLALLTLIWSAKESLYKAYGQKEVDFREHLLVKAHPNLENALVGKINLPHYQSESIVEFRWHENYVLTWTILDENSIFEIPS